MAAKEIFTTDNQIMTKWGQGVCTAFALAWASKTLQSKRGLRSRHDLPSPMELERRHHKNGEIEETDFLSVVRRSGLNSAEQGNVQEFVVKSFAQLTSHVRTVAPHVAIFWNSHHTMGYQYAHGRKEFFDPEVGLFRAKTTQEIEEKMDEVFTAKNYDPVDACLVVQLA